MSYVKQTWATGDVITAEKLNHIENGIEGAGGGEILWVTLKQGDPATCDKTHAEIINAMETGRVIAKLGVSSTISGASYLPFPTPDEPVTFTFIDITDNDKLHLTVASVDGTDTVTMSTHTFNLSSAN